MKAMRSILIHLVMAILATLLLPGCYAYKHSRSHIDPDGTQVEETTYVRSKFQDSSAGQISSRTTTNDRGVYSREIGFENLAVLTDEDSLRVIEEIAGSVTRGILGTPSGKALVETPREPAEPP